ncbi:MAG TPA: hypothetical protein VNV14_03165 [Opitutaceae bacterium]|jgi:hypothetical protein|nr:hypothetical protein [Opitutaceae bacterium]
MKSSCLIRLSAIFILIAFAISFFLPVYSVEYDKVGWEVAYETLGETFRLEGSSVITMIYFILSDGLLDLANLVTPLILVMLGANRFRGRISLFVLVILALCVANSARLMTDHLLIGYWVWWGCQVATLAIGIWSRFCSPRAAPAHA